MDINKFKDVMGRWLTQSLFYEYRNDNYTPSFTLKPYDHEVDGVVYPSMKLLYLKHAYAPHTGEYEFAMTVLGSWELWERLCATQVLAGYIAEWRKELEIKVTSMAIASMIQSAKHDGSKGIPAAKYLAEKGYLGSKRGRPSKEEVASEKKRQAEVMAQLEADMNRIKPQAILEITNG